MIRYLERDLASSDQHVKELMPLREGLHEMMQCDMRQHFAERYWVHEYLRRRASWRESTGMKFMNIEMESSMMRSESSQCMSETTGFFV